MGLFTLGFGKITCRTEREGRFIRMGICTKGIGGRTNPTEGESICIATARDTPGRGGMISRTGRERKPGPMERAIRAVTPKAKSRDKDSLLGRMALFTQANLKPTILKASAFTSGRINENTRVCGNKTKCMGRECSNGGMEGNTSASSIWIRGKGKE